MSSASRGPKVPKTIANGKYELKKRLGAGCFGEVYRAVVVGGDEEVAVKVEEPGCSSPQLEHEASVLEALKDDESRLPRQGFAQSFYYGKESTCNVLVIELLGRSLEDRMQACRTFTPRTGVLVAEQVLRRIEYLHSKGILHRDIKPENFCWGIGPRQAVLYLIDFGLSKRYYDKSHVMMRNKLNLTGTARYASINAHRGLEQSRRDDLEAIGHMLMYFLRGSLPWSGLDAKTKQEKYRRIMEKKMSTALSDLCNGFPSAFETYLAYCRNLCFKERPNYNKCRQMFRDVRLKMERETKTSIKDSDFDWFDSAEPPGDLVSLDVNDAVLQPDDPRPSAAARSRFLCCFCGSTRAVAE